MTVPAPPKGSGPRGRKLWREVMEAWELDEHERALLIELCRTHDQLEVLHGIVEAEGTIIDSPTGRRTHPAVVEARQQRIAAARLTAVLRLPGGAEGDEIEGRRQQRRVGVRGIHPGQVGLRRVQ